MSPLQSIIRGKNNILKYGQKCIFCEAIAQGYVTPRFRNIFPKISPEKQILYQTNFSILIPDDSPLVQDHLLIVTKHHFISFASTNYEVLLDLENLKKRIIMFIKKIDSRKKVLFFEHGPGKINNRIQRCGSCFGHDHAHLHVVPLKNKQIEIITFLNKYLTKSLSILPKEINRAQDMMNYFNKPYIYIELNGIRRLFIPSFRNASCIPSQYIRRVIGLYLQLGDNYDLRHLHTHHRPLVKKRINKTLDRFVYFC